MNFQEVKERIKTHYKDHKPAYLCIGTGIGVAGITALIMRGVASQHISPGIAGTADHGIAVTGENVVMNNVSLISSNRQGSPSWVVRCLETGQTEPSQRALALSNEWNESDLSQHLNGRKPHVNGYHVERIAMAAT